MFCYQVFQVFLSLLHNGTIAPRGMRQMYFHVLLYWIYYMVIICLGAVRVINIIFITNIIIIIITTISMIISLDLLTGGIKLVGNQGLVILYCNAIQAYQ